MCHVTTAECEAALSHILDASSEAAVEVLCHRADDGERDFREFLNLSVATGIEDERWMKRPWLTLEDGSPDPRIQVSILQKRVLDLCWRDRDNVVFPGDTMIVDMDLSHKNLPVGTRLQAGTAVLEVSDKFNDACAKWKVRHGRESYDWINQPEHIEYRLRGVLCKIVQDGTVRLGDVLQKI
jgi:hypothetical protein